MSQYIVKTYSFKTKPQLSAKDFLRVSAQMDNFALAADGFVYRSVAQIAEHEWLDCVYWSSASAAKKAEAVMEQPFMQAFMDCIVEGSVVCHEAVIATQVYPEMHQAPPQP
jgi:hypothetical protein